MGTSDGERGMIMKVFYAIVATLFAVAEYYVLTDNISQPLVSAALGAGTGYFLSMLVLG